jgi:hypothetical protein
MLQVKVTHICMRAARCRTLKEYSMDGKLQKELEIQTQNFKGLIADYCRFESVAAQNRMMKETADWVENLLQADEVDSRVN